MTTPNTLAVSHVLAGVAMGEEKPKPKKGVFVVMEGDERHLDHRTVPL